MRRHKPKALREKKKLFGKRGSAFDVIAIGVILLVVSLALIIFHYSWNTMSPILQERLGSNEVNMTSESNETLQNVFTTMDSTTGIADFVVVAVMVALVLGIMLASFSIDVPPAFTILFILITVLAVLLAIPLSNAFIAFENSAPAGIQASISAFPMTIFIMEKLPIFIGAIGTLALVITYAKGRGGGSL